MIDEFHLIRNGIQRKKGDPFLCFQPLLDNLSFAGASQPLDVVGGGQKSGIFCGGCRSLAPAPGASSLLDRGLFRLT